MGWRAAVFTYTSFFPCKPLAQSGLTVNICWVNDLIALPRKEGDDLLHAASESLMIANE